MLHQAGRFGARAHRGGRIELRMSSVCVSGCFVSTGGSFFPPFAPGLPFDLSFVVSSDGVSYLTSDMSGGPGILALSVSWADAKGCAAIAGVTGVVSGQGWCVVVVGGLA